MSQKTFFSKPTEFELGKHWYAQWPYNLTVDYPLVTSIGCNSMSDIFNGFVVDWGSTLEDKIGYVSCRIESPIKMTKCKLLRKNKQKLPQ